MTEEEWLENNHPILMLGIPGVAISNRKLRLFACACCRRVWNFVSDERLLTTLDTLEQYADKLVGEKQRLAVARLSTAVREQHWEQPGKEEEVSVAGEVLNASAKSMHRVLNRCGSFAAAAFAWAEVGDFHNRMLAEEANQTALVRDIFGNPFRKVKFKPAWRTSDVLALARGIYDDRAFDRMPILADALQDAGCDNDDILSHCRDANQVHVRGCWVVDLILGKS